MADIQNLRADLDMITDEIVCGLAGRSRYLLNSGIFIEKKGVSNITLFEQKLIDYASKGKLYHEPVIEIPQMFDQKIIEIYTKALAKICKPGENKTEYEQVVEKDINNFRLYSERVKKYGVLIADSKIKNDESFLLPMSRNALQQKLVDEDREKKVIKYALNIAKLEELENDAAISEFFKNLMSLTVDVEILYVERKVFENGFCF
jgi:chorismate mutase